MPDEPTRLVHASGECEIDLARRQLRVSGSFVPVGGRAFQIIEVLADSAGELVTKDELLDRIWPGAIVGENTLHVHAGAIRKALGPYRGLLKTESGRGYRLLGDWTVRPQNAAGPPVGPQRMRVDGESPVTNFPAAVTRLVGRTAGVARLRDLMSAYRLVTLTGPGGIGKSSLALKAARGVVGEFADGAWLVELASLSDPALVSSAVADALRVPIGLATVTPETIARSIGAKRLLLVLDNCEHLIEAAATLAETLLARCPHTAIIATSRETFRIAGEQVYRVPPLEVPAAGRDDADHILSHGAVELFIARTTELNAGFSSHAGELSSIGAICRHLDGIPLAIEFAAAQASALGVQTVAARLHDRFALLTSGRRTALPRHRTLRGVLDWSYELLPEAEQRLLRHLAIFSGGFTAEAAAAVASDGIADRFFVVEGIANLIAKSLVVPARNVSSRWFLLETIRAYALEKLSGLGEREVAALRHATYFRDLFPRSAKVSGVSPSENDPRGKYRDIDNVRAALDWCFSAGGDRALGVDLTVGYGLGLPVVVVATGGGGQSLDLLTKALDTAEGLDDLDAQARALIGLLSLHNFRGELEEARAAAARLLQAADRHGNAALSRNAGRLMGNALVSLGRPREARGFLESYLNADRSIPDQRRPSEFALEDRGLAHAQLSRALWMLGFIDQARREAEASLADPRETDQPLVLCRILYFGMCRILPTTGDFAAAEQNISRLMEAATALNEPYWHTAERFISGKLMIELGQFAQGVAVLNDAFDARGQTGWRTSYPEFKGALAMGLSGLGQLDEALAAVNEGLGGAVQGEEGHDLYFAELLRIKGEILLRRGSVTAAEASFHGALVVARQQETLLWELRAALGLAPAPETRPRRRGETACGRGFRPLHRGLRDTRFACRERVSGRTSGVTHAAAAGSLTWQACPGGYRGLSHCPADG
jgi:predicted ATPase/DNA-binding winged helix-turn-helix (wHTH) protein